MGPDHACRFRTIWPASGKATDETGLQPIETVSFFFRHPAKPYSRTAR
jgi:hypothetical protein